MSERPIFAKPILAILICGVTAIFALSMLLLANGPGEERGNSTTTKSVSAIGHAAIYVLAERSGIPVARSRLNGIAAPGEGGLLVTAEPYSYRLGTDEIIRLGRQANLLLVLPKRHGIPDKEKHDWIAQARLLELGEVQSIARLVEPGLEIVRGKAPANWGTNRIGVDASFDDGAQLIKSGVLQPVVGDAGGMLIGEKRDGDRRIWILADPDIMENHGLSKGGNATFMLAVFNAMRQPGGRVVFDETVHGLVNIVESPFKALFRFPLVIVLMLLLGAVALLMWATTSRFGGVHKAPPPFDVGKKRLIVNTASLLERAGHHGFVLSRYVSETLRDAGRLFHAPRRLSDQDLAAWLDAIGESRGVSIKASEILARSTAKRQSLPALFEAAHDMHEWKEKVVNGTSARR